MKKQFEDETTQLEANILPPTLRAELRRYQDIEAALNSAETENIGLAVIHASLIAATPSGSLVYNGEAVKWPPSLDDCLDRMSRAAFDAWTEWVYEANPAWKPKAFENEEQEKKAETTPGIGPLDASPS